MSASSLPKANGQSHVKAFARLGWSEKRRAGSHIVMTKPGVPAILSIPNHREVAIGTLRQLVRAAGLTDEEYLEAFDRR